ncbi:aminotransferase class IV [Streptomyces sp. DSM 15324]|uniref:L-amino acid aminotransferase n=1 Tax=Streptomyces cinnabarigriseus TaxID=319633 RepID=F0V3Y0_9ACTN|nr:aminotransferase class IV [Streptomyces sp. DSM 15324]KUO12367.1 branched-chain amino acid aminotransferase [Streptomyces sp. DSM 15324]CBW54663.1 L-amino acid aminotransferase [Streptomyces cinnabarigriseus]
MGPQDSATLIRPALGLGAWAYDRGEFVPATAPRLPLSTQGLHYGTGAFEGIRAHRSDAGVFLFRAHDHYQRLLRACRLLRITGIRHDAGELVDLTVELLRRNAHDTDAYVRPVAYKLSLLPGTPPGVSLRGVSDALSITTFGFPQTRAADGVRAVLSGWRRPAGDSLPAQAKITGGYATTALACDEARASGYDDAILLDRAGNVAEATTANVFAVIGGTLVTPPDTGDLLPGITRDTLITLCREAGTEVRERVLRPADLFTADEVFLSSTGNGVVPVTSLSGRDVGTGAVGPVTTRVRELYTEAVSSPGGAHPEWLTPVSSHATPTSGKQG